MKQYKNPILFPFLLVSGMSNSNSLVTARFILNDPDDSLLLQLLGI
jgi:hypothetical protein